jgi:nucleoside-diphosphate-sugar epimerase
MKILVAGGAGYLGSRLVSSLVGQGHNVEVLDLLWFGNHLSEGIKVHKMDVLSVSEEFLRGYEQVIFVAGLSNDPMAEFSPSMNFISNAAAPAYLAFMSKKVGVKRFIYASSGSIYGMTGKKLLDEKVLPGSENPYGISKAEGEFGAMRLVGENFSVISFRNGTISGWSPRMRLDLIVNTMYMKSMTEGKLTINNPSIWRPILAISDAVEAYSKAVSLPYNVNGVYNLCSGNFFVGEVGQAVADHFKKTRGVQIKVEINHTGDLRDYAMSTKKIEKDFGWKPKGTIQSILAELDANLGEKFNFVNDEWYNIKTFKKLFPKGIYPSY